MSRTEILVIGRNEEILEVVLRLINNNPAWTGTGACADEDAIEKFHRQPRLNFWYGPNHRTNCQSNSGACAEQ